jgi:hypothetical protein
MHDDANTVATTLMGAAARLRAGWCPGAISRDSEGRIVGPKSHEAAAWDAEGALAAVAPTDAALTAADEAARAALGLPACESLAAFEQRRAEGVEQIARAFERAAEEVMAGAR